MSKKLMMNNYSENGLIPVMDGLVCWLDGRDYNGGNTVKDRINKKEFTVEGIISDEYSFLYNQSSGAIFAEFKTDEDMYNLFNSDFTLCFEDKLGGVVSGGVSDYPCGFPRLIHFNANIGNSPYQLIYNKDTNAMEFSNYTSFGYKTLMNIDICKNLAKKSIVVVKNNDAISFYLNGIRYNSISDTKNTVINLTRLTLGNNYLCTRTYYGNIYSFMAYNRALTEEEIAQNYAYEQSINRGE